MSDVMTATEKKSPGTVLTEMMEKCDLNYNRLAKAIDISSATVRLISRDNNPITDPIAIKLAEYFKTSPEYWLKLQSDFDNANAIAEAEGKPSAIIPNERYPETSEPVSPELVQKKPAAI